jgi:LPXTG-motif cell wall-anchored protein
VGVDGSGTLEGIISVSGGGNHSLAVSASGVYAWGLNASGQVGNGTTSDSTTPVLVPGVAGEGVLAGATTVSAGGNHSVAATPLGVYAWGYNELGQLGAGSTSDSSFPVLSANLQVTTVLFGSNAGTAISRSGSNWTVTSPAGSAGTVALTATANLFGGVTEGGPTTVSWDAGAFTYEAALTNAEGSSSEDALAATGSTWSGILIILGLSALLGGLVLTMFRKKLTA